MNRDLIDQQLRLISRMVAETSPEPPEIATLTAGLPPRSQRSRALVLGSAVVASLVVGAGLILTAHNLSEDLPLGTDGVPPLLDEGFAAVWLGTSESQRLIIGDGEVSFAELQEAHSAAVTCVREAGDWYAGGDVTPNGAASITVTDDRGITDNPGPTPTGETAGEARERCLAEHFDDVYSLYVAPVDPDTIELAAGPFVWIDEGAGSSAVEAALAFARTVLHWPSPTVTINPEAFVPPGPGDYDYTGMIGLTHGDSSRVLLISAAQLTEDGPYGVLQLGNNERPGGVNSITVGQAGSSVEEGSLVGLRPVSGAEVGIPPLLGAHTAAVFIRTVDSRLISVIVSREALQAGRFARRWVSIGETGLTTYLDIESVLVLYLDAEGRAIGATGGSSGPAVTTSPDRDDEGLPYLGFDLTGWEFWRAAESEVGCSDSPTPMPGRARQASYTFGSLPAGEHPLVLGIATLNVNVTTASTRCSFQDVPSSASDLGPPADPPAVIDHGMISVMGHEARVVEEQGTFSVYWLLDDEGSVANLDIFPHDSPLTLEDVVAITAGVVELTREQWDDLLARTPETPPDTVP